MHHCRRVVLNIEIYNVVSLDWQRAKTTYDFLTVQSNCAHNYKTDKLFNMFILQAPYS